MNEGEKGIFSEEVRIVDGACQADNISLFAGDMLTEAEKEMRDEDGDKGAEVLVAAHALAQALTYHSHLLTMTIQQATAAIHDELTEIRGLMVVSELRAQGKDPHTVLVETRAGEVAHEK